LILSQLLTVLSPIFADSLHMGQTVQLKAA